MGAAENKRDNGGEFALTERDGRVTTSAFTSRAMLGVPLQPARATTQPTVGGVQHSESGELSGCFHEASRSVVRKSARAAADRAIAAVEVDTFAAASPAVTTARPPALLRSLSDPMHLHSSAGAASPTACARSRVEAGRPESPSAMAAAPTCRLMAREPRDLLTALALAPATANPRDRALARLLADCPAPLMVLDCSTTGKAAQRDRLSMSLHGCNDVEPPQIPVVLYVNRPFELATGYSWAEVVGQDSRFMHSPPGHVAVA